MHEHAVFTPYFHSKFTDCFNQRQAFIITAGALRDNNVAKLIGTKTYGKGSVQQLLKLADGSMLKVTSAHWYTPSGKGIDKAGLEPDQKVERSDDDVKNNRDPQREAALQAVRQ